MKLPKSWKPVTIQSFFKIYLDNHTSKYFSTDHISRWLPWYMCVIPRVVIHYDSSICHGRYLIPVIPPWHYLKYSFYLQHFKTQDNKKVLNTNEDWFIFFFLIPLYYWIINFIGIKKVKLGNYIFFKEFKWRHQKGMTDLGVLWRIFSQPPVGLTEIMENNSSTVIRSNQNITMMAISKKNN